MKTIEIVPSAKKTSFLFAYTVKIMIRKVWNLITNLVFVSFVLKNRQ